MKEFLINLGEALSPYKFRLIGLTIGLVIAVLFLTIGFFKTIFIVLCTGIGFAIGYFMDDKSDLGEMIDKIMARVKGEK